MQFDFARERDDMVYLKSMLQVKKNDLTQAQKTMQVKSQLQEKYNISKKLSDELDLLMMINKFLLEKAEEEDIAFKNRRLDHISGLITDFLTEIFPERGFHVKISCDFSRGMKTSLSLLDKRGIERLIHISEGKFLQSLVGFGGALSVAVNVGATILYLDEAFAVADAQSLMDVSRLYRALLDDGIQIFMIEQTTPGYQDLPRREFHLTYNTITEQAEGPEVYDIGA